MASNMEQRLTGRRFALRGYERVASMAPAASMKIVHAMLVRGPPIAELLPTAVMHTFNKHPRMRVLQLKGVFATAEIQPPVALDEVKSRRLLRSQCVSGDDEWQQYVARECEIPFDRFADLPFFLTVWSNEAKRETRLMLFSDHYMSDGFTGEVVLNDILEQVALAAMNYRSGVVPPLKELPLLPGMQLDSLSIVRPLAEIAVKMFGQTMFRSEIQGFQPLLPARSDQKDFQIPVVVNTTHACFSEGLTANYENALARCKTERVTVTGAVVAAVILAYYHAAVAFGRHFDPKCFKVALDVDYNMRKRVLEPAEEDHVGNYVAMHSIDRLGKKGIDLTTERFWDVARAARTDIHSALNSNLMLSLQSVLMDQVAHSEMTLGTLGVKIPNSMLSDANISSLGKYPFAKTHSLGDSAGPESKLMVESLHHYNVVPTFAPGARVFISSVNRFGYAMAHKYEGNVASTLFRAIVTVCEHMSSIGESETMLNVARQLGVMLRNA